MQKGEKKARTFFSPFNGSLCIRYAESFYAIRTPLYYYARHRKHSLSASVNPAQVVTTKASLFKYYKELYVQLGLYDQYKLQIYSYLVATARDLD